MEQRVEVSAETVDRGKRLDAFLHERLPRYSRARLQGWIKQGRVLVDSAATRPSYLLHGAECVVVSPAELAPLQAEAEALPLTVLYEDRDVIVVDKPAGMVVHAGAGHHRGTLVNALLHRFGTLSRLNGDERPGIVHRLDRDTSGVLAVARTDVAHRALAEQFLQRTVEKIYFAMVQGVVKPAEGRIALPIARDPVRRTRMTTRIATGRPALTSYRVLDTSPGRSFLEILLGTGRTHQIRVHMAALGHPVVGDRLYGAAAVPGLDRFFLHAHRLDFDSPSTGERIRVESPLPPELVALR